jgi:hypothetical protein
VLHPDVRRYGWRDFLSGVGACADSSGPRMGGPMRRKRRMGKGLLRQPPPRELSAAVHYLVHCS